MLQKHISYVGSSDFMQNGPSITQINSYSYTEVLSLEGKKKKKKCHRYLTVFNNRLIKAEYGLQFSTILVWISRIANENCGQWLTLLELQCVITPSDKEKHLRTHFRQNNLSNKGFFPVTVCLVCLNTTCSALPTKHSKSSVFIQSTLECQVLIYLLLKPISLPLKAH